MIYIYISLQYINMYNYASFKIAKLKRLQPLEMGLYLTSRFTYGECNISIIIVK